MKTCRFCHVSPALLHAFAAALTLFNGGCGKHLSVADAGARDGILHVGNSAEPRNLDPATAVSVTEANLLGSLFEGLTTYAPDCRRVLPGAAESWDVSPDGRTYTFHLRPGLKWSDGAPLTSDDFLYSFRRIIEPPLAAEQAIYADWIVGAQDYREGKTHDFAAVGLRAPDPLTFEVKLKERAPFFLGLLATNPWYPVQRATLEKHDAYLRRESDWTRPGSLVGNGPFRLKAWRTNDAVVVEKNPFYHDAANVRLQEVFYHPIDSADTEERAFRGGLLHATRFLPATKLEGYHRDHADLVHSDPEVGTNFMDFNVSRPPFNDVRVRRAFALAVDRDAIVGQVLRDGSRAAVGLAVPGSGGYEPRARLAYDPERARALMAEAGFPGGANFPGVSMVFAPSQQGVQATVEAMQAMWQKTLGVRVDLVAKEEKVWLDTIRTRDFQMLADGWSSSINDPADMLQNWLSQSPNNDTHWVSEKYDAEYAAAGQAASDAERLAHFQNADAILVDELPVIPVFHKNRNYLVAPSVRGWQDNLLGWHPPTGLFFPPTGGGRE